MRHPDRLEHISRAEAQLPQVLATVGLPADTPLVRDTEGWVNLCYLADEVVIRFNARDPQLPKFQREAFVYERLAAERVPVPELLFYDGSGRFGGYPVLVTRRLPGRNVEASWPDLSPEERKQIAGEAGRMLARIHGIEFSGYGEVFAPQYQSWAEYLITRAQAFLRDCRDLEIFDQTRTAKLDETIIRGVQGLSEGSGFREEDGASLVHGDYHFGNLLHEGKVLTGVVDFEWAFAGDPAWDLLRADKMEQYWPGSAAAFQGGYGELRPWTAELLERCALYRIVHLLEIAIVAARFYSSDEAHSYRERVLDEVEDWSCGDGRR